MPCKECEKLGDLCLECARHEANWRRAENAALKERAEKAEQARDAAIRELGEYARQRGLADHERDEAVRAERERCAKVVEYWGECCGVYSYRGHVPLLKEYAPRVAAAIRAGEEKGNV